MVIAFGVITCLLSAFVSNTATVAMLLPTALGILAVIAKLLQSRGLTQPGWDPTRCGSASRGWPRDARPLALQGEDGQWEEVPTLPAIGGGGSNPASGRSSQADGRASD